MIRKLLRRIYNGVGRPVLRRAGLELISTRSGGARATMRRAMSAAAGRGHNVATVIDIGASNGRWSETAMEHFPDCRFLLIEAQSIHAPELSSFVGRHPRTEYVLAAAGDSCGHIYFDQSDPLGGSASKAPSPSHTASIPVTTLDHEVFARGLPGPFLIKFDTHGFELPILAGASATLARTEIIVMECYNFPLSDDCLTFDEMCRHLRTLGFRCIDLADPLYRPSDDVLWQMDLVFARDNRAEFGNLAYE